MSNEMHNIQLSTWELTILRVALCEKEAQRLATGDPCDAVVARWCASLWSNLLAQELGLSEVWTQR